MVFYAMEPFGIEAEYLGHAITASTVANAMHDPKKHGAFTVEDFMPKFDEAAQQRGQKSPEELWMNFKTWALIAGDNSHGNPG